MNHAFTLRVSGIETTGNYEDRLYEAGCIDALVAVVGERFISILTAKPRVSRLRYSPPPKTFNGPAVM